MKLMKGILCVLAFLLLTALWPTWFMWIPIGLIFLFLAGAAYGLFEAITS